MDYRGQRKIPLLDRFWSKVDIQEGCWIWTGTIATSGYGVFHLPRTEDGQVLVYAHRFMWEIVNKEMIPFGMEDGLIMHSCDNKICVNTDHLAYGSSFENINDAIQKGRFTQMSIHLPNYKP